MWLKKLFFILFIRPLVLLVTGVHIKGREHLPLDGSAILVANHNSHLDTLVIMSLFPLKTLKKVRPIGAYDYFFKNSIMRWISTHLIDVIALRRKLSKVDGHPFEAIYSAIDDGDILLLFPEGSRGEPEEIQPFKTGIAHIAQKYPNTPIIPLYIHGAGKVLPKGEALFVPFIIDVNIGKAILYDGSDKEIYTENLYRRILELEAEVKSRV